MINYVQKFAGGKVNIEVSDPADIYKLSTLYADSSEARVVDIDVGIYRLINGVWTYVSGGPQGGMLHSVGCAQPSALAFISRWDKESQNNVCVHGVIDANNGKVYQCLRWFYRGWHGGGSDLFIVTITVTDGRPSTISADHTLAEINAAYNDGKVVVGKVVLHNKVAEYVAVNRSVAETKVIFPRAAFLLTI